VGRFGMGGAGVKLWQDLVLEQITLLKKLTEIRSQLRAVEIQYRRENFIQKTKSMGSDKIPSIS